MAAAFFAKVKQAHGVVAEALALWPDAQDEINAVECAGPMQNKRNQRSCTDLGLEFQSLVIGMKGLQEAANCMQMELEETAQLPGSTASASAQSAQTAQTEDAQNPTHAQPPQEPPCPGTGGGSRPCTAATTPCPAATFPCTVHRCAVRATLGLDVHRGGG